MGLCNYKLTKYIQFEVRHTLHAEITADTFEVMEVCQEKGTKEAKDMILNLSIQRPLLLVNSKTEYINLPSDKTYLATTMVALAFALETK